MKLPQLIVMDAGYVFSANGRDVEESAETLINICTHAEIPLYLTGTGFECVRIPQKVQERIKGIYRIKHCSDALWYQLQVQHRLKSPAMLRVSANQSHRVLARNFGMTPVAVADTLVNHLGYCFETSLHTDKDHIFSDMDAFVHALAARLNAAADYFHRAPIAA